MQPRVRGQVIMVLYWRAEQLLWMKHVTSAQGMEGCSTTAAEWVAPTHNMQGSCRSSSRQGCGIARASALERAAACSRAFKRSFRHVSPVGKVDI